MPDIAAVYVSVVAELGKLDSLRGLFSPDLIGSFAILGLIALAAKNLLKLIVSGLLGAERKGSWINRAN